MNKYKFNTGDFCFFEFELVYIIKAERGKVLQIKNGIGRTAGDLTDRCFELCPDLLEINSGFMYWSHQFDDLKYDNFNYPGLHTYLVEKWLKACSVCKNENEVNRIMHQVSMFGAKVIMQARSLEFGDVDGVKLLMV